MFIQIYGGPIKLQSMGGAKYFMSLVDDFSRKVWLYLLKSKDEAIHAFKKWKTLVENQTGRRLKKLRTDNVLEFCSEKFNKVCESLDIARHKTVKGTSQQNGLAERMNKTLVERIRCMMLTSRISKVFWGDAAQTTCYLINRCLSSALNFKTPQVWTGKQAEYIIIWKTLDIQPMYI